MRYELIESLFVLYSVYIQYNELCMHLLTYRHIYTLLQVSDYYTASCMFSLLLYVRCRFYYVRQYCRNKIAIKVLVNSSSYICVYVNTMDE